MSRLSVYRESVIQLGYEFVKSRVLETAFELDLFERIGNGARTARTLAEEAGADRNSLELFLNALVSLGFLASEGRAYRNTNFGKELFLKGKSLYVGDIVRLKDTSGGDWFKLKTCLLTGRPADRPPFLKPDDVSATENFARAMHNTAMGHAEVLSKRLSLEPAKTLLDLGGGPGTFTIHFLKANPELSATIFDLPQTLQITRKFVDEARVGGRVTYQAGDFNSGAVPGTFDVCFLSHIIHGQSAEKNQALFRKIFRCLNPGGRLIVQDFLLNADKQSPQFAALFALTMLLYTDGGRTYAFDEVETWMREAGFARTGRPALRLPRSIALVTGEKR